MEGQQGWVELAIATGSFYLCSPTQLHPFSETPPYPSSFHPCWQRRVWHCLQAADKAWHVRDCLAWAGHCFLSNILSLPCLLEQPALPPCTALLGKHFSVPAQWGTHCSSSQAWTEDLILSVPSGQVVVPVTTPCFLLSRPAFKFIYKTAVVTKETSKDHHEFP